MKRNNDFKYDLQLGKMAEDKIADIFTNKKLEVKRDFKALETGNVFIEYTFRNMPSGLSTTEADFYVFVISFSQIIIIETKKLKDLCRKYVGTPMDKRGGNNAESRGILLSLDELITG